MSRSDQVRTLAFACLAGSAALDILKDLGINIGAQLTPPVSPSPERGFTYDRARREAATMNAG